MWDLTVTFALCGLTFFTVAGFADSVIGIGLVEVIFASPGETPATVAVCANAPRAETTNKEAIGILLNISKVAQEISYVGDTQTCHVIVASTS